MYELERLIPEDKNHKSMKGYGDGFRATSFPFDTLHRVWSGI